MLVVNRTRRTWTDSSFELLATHFKQGDLLVLNNTRVLKARLFGTLERTGRSVEILFADPIDRHSWKALLDRDRRVRAGERIALRNNVALEVGERGVHGLRTLSMIDASGPTILEILEKDGHLPLPPYMDRDDRPADETDYQTVYANRDGAIAAPTAGLHFSHSVFSSLEAAGIQTAELTLHVGIGTFIPVRTDDPAQHQLKAERFEISESAAERLNEARAEGRRIIAVGHDHNAHARTHLGETRPIPCGDRANRPLHPSRSPIRRRRWPVDELPPATHYPAPAGFSLCLPRTGS